MFTDATDPRMHRRKIIGMKRRGLVMFIDSIDPKTPRGKNIDIMSLKKETCIVLSDREGIQAANHTAFEIRHGVSC